MEAILITGGSSGIGQALAWQFAKQGRQVFIIGRHLDKLQQTAAKFNTQIIPIQADIAIPESRKLIASVIGNTKLQFLVHNAASIDPFAMLPDLSLEAWRNTIATNLEAPIFLTQALLPFLQKDSRILNLSSGFARYPLRGLMAYCTSKAALYMAYKIFNTELNSQGIYAGSIDPGVIDTEMQTRLRAQNKVNLPDVNIFHDYKNQGKLLPSTQVAALLAQFLENTPNHIFTEKEWSIYELMEMFPTTS